MKYVGHDVTEAGNCPAQSKFDLIDYWIIPPKGKYLFSFIGIVNFYHLYAPYFWYTIEAIEEISQTLLPQTNPSNGMDHMDPTTYYAFLVT